MTQALDQSIAELLHASRDYESILEFEVADRIFGFHAQQAVEKLLKVVIGAHGERFEHTHDLGTLVRHAEGLGEHYEIKEALLKFLTAYASVWRYQHPDPFTMEERDQLRSLVTKTHTLERLRALRLEIDWTEA